MRAVIQSSKLKIAKDYADGEGMYQKSASTYGVNGTKVKESNFLWTFSTESLTVYPFPALV